MSSKIALLEQRLRIGGTVAVSGAVTNAWPVRWVLMLVLVYAASAVITVRPIIDPDIWWHLRTGQWVVEHRTVPLTDPFSTSGAERPWVAYSWLFGVAVYELYEAFGLAGLLAYALLGGLAVTSALMLFIMRFESRVPRALALTAVGLAALGPVLMPRAYLFTICFFIVEVSVLLTVRDTGRIRSLWILPPMFALWANLHIQFVHGLLVLAMAIMESLVVHYEGRFQTFERQCVPLRPAVLTAAACLLATLVTPYGGDLYRPVVEHSEQRLAYRWIIELAAPTFRQPAHWVFLALAFGAAFLIGRQRRLQIFPTLLLVSGAYFSFAANRDAWFLVIASVAVVATTQGDRSLPRPHLRWTWVLAAVLGVALAVAGVGFSRALSPATLEAAVAREFPVAAVGPIRERGYPGPLYNNFDWGGFLIWSLPEYRVAIDGRANLHGDDRMRRSISTWAGLKGWDGDHDMHAARLVIAPVDSALTELLRRHAEYEVVYEDAVASVLIRRAAADRAAERSISMRSSE